VSVDGFAAGPNQRLEEPFGDGDVERVHEWMFEGREDNVSEVEAIVAAGAFILTHHPREPLVMEGGTTYTFVTDGIESALEQARAAAGDRNVAIAGGPATVNQYLAAGLIDELRLHVAPLLLGVGERLFEGAPNVRLQPVAGRHTDRVTHLTYRFSR
jgi:dihydrofolate reductase